MKRIAGEAELKLFHENNEVKDALFLSRAPVRGFENVVKGKSPLFAIEAVMRICGICHASHGNASAMAIENALGIQPPRNANLMREALGLMNRTQSHLVQLIMFAEDVLEKTKIDKAFPQLLDIHDEISEYLIEFGGGATHPPNITIGGLDKHIEEEKLKEAKKDFQEIKENWNKLRQKFFNESELNGVAQELINKKSPENYLATHLFYGDRYNVSSNEVESIDYDEYRSHEEAKKATTLISKYKNNTVEVGPRARLWAYRDFDDDSLFGIHRARIKEMDLAFNRIIEIFDQIDSENSFRTQNLVFGPGKGKGVFEAPRGTLFHFVKLSGEGRIRSYNIVVPTMFNIPIMEKAAKGLSPKGAEAVMRLYDPCIPCTTHKINLRS